MSCGNFAGRVTRLCGVAGSIPRCGAGHRIRAQVLPAGTRRDDVRPESRSWPFAATRARALRSARSAAHPNPEPSGARRLVAIAPFHQDSQFVYPSTPDASYPDVEPLVDAGVSDSRPDRAGHRRTLHRASRQCRHATGSRYVARRLRVSLARPSSTTAVPRTPESAVRRPRRRRPMMRGVRQS